MEWGKTRGREANQEMVAVLQVRTNKEQRQWGKMRGQMRRVFWLLIDCGVRDNKECKKA